MLSVVASAFMSGIQNTEIKITSELYAQLQSANDRNYATSINEVAQILRSSALPSSITLDKMNTAPPGIPITPTTISLDHEDLTTQAALGSLTARPTNNIVGT